ncbi:MAG: alpha-glucosidase/alpha-galactosidase [Opitutales bacterium]
MSFRIAFIGAGSLGFTRKLLADLMAVPAFQETPPEIVFHDIDADNLERVRRLCQRDLDANEARIQILATLDRREAISGAKYVLSTVRIGGLETYRDDIEIPLEYGVDQCVGDTLGPGGLMYAQRGIPAMLDFCRDIREVARPDCLFLNYSNPMAMLTWAAIEAGGVDTIGLCHGVQGGHRQIAEVLGLPKEEVDIICAGINHQTWYIQVKHQGVDRTGDLLEAFEKHENLSQTQKVRIDVLRRFGYFSTESNGHLSEYLAWYRKRPEEIQEWISLDHWIHGETGGYLRSCTERENWFTQEFEAILSEPAWNFAERERSEEHGSYIIEGLETDKIYRGHFNRQNQGVIANLPEDCIIEAPGYVDANGIAMPTVGDLPLGCAAICQQSINVQRMGMRAALSGDATLLKQAMTLDPLTAAVCNPAEVWEMTDRMLVAQAQWLPQYAQSGAIDAAKATLATGPKLARFPGNRGAARQRVKSVEERAAEEAQKAASKETLPAHMQSG